MDTHLTRIHPFLPPFLIGFSSLLGICWILAFVWLDDRQPASAPTSTPVRFHFLWVATQTAISVPELVTSVPLRDPSTPTAGSDSPGSALIEPVATSIGGDPLSPGNLPAASMEPSPTLQVSERCAAPSTVFLDAVTQVAKSTDLDNTLGTAWVVRSSEQGELWTELWFLAARLHGPGGEAGTPPAVWALLFYSEGYFDVYAINGSAMQFSSAAWGEGHAPPLTMRLDGAQQAYDCSAMQE